ncbi:hypothetical protein R1flu_011935 [Riccia fluitans]|uniref:Peptidase A1 domain-containing protein n=1 Tax=Riccia fluitans TaxID=41844 RepID=A0ABD1Z9F3_9MARC
MQRVTVIKLFAVLVVCCSCLVRWAEAELVLPFHHKFSQKAKEEHYVRGLGSWPFPDPGTVDFRKLLHQHDLARHGRMLATTPQNSYTFLDGNLTFSLFGGLYYTFIDVGTPGVPFLVGLDTGSDLFWLPCECESCAPATAPIYQDYGIDKPFKRYAPLNSTTSKTISCSSDQCNQLLSQCLPNEQAQECRYEANYASVNTSTSGKLVEDVVHLTPNSGPQTPITVPVVIGCGQVQTGSFLDGGVPDGLIGLGLQDFSVPASLAKTGLMADSFSMCLGPDFTGRVVFGDLGGKSLTKTRLLKPSNPRVYDTYYVKIESVKVGDEVIAVGEAALFDTGTSYTYLNSSLYQEFISSFENQTTNYKRFAPGTTDPWELCYHTSNTTVVVPNIDFVFGGSASMSIRFPFEALQYVNRTLAGFCLAVFESNVNIIGANFMVGQNIVFNRGARTLGFEESDCYSTVTDAGSSPVVQSPLPSSANAPASTPSIPSPPSDSAPIPAGLSSDAATSSLSLIALLSLGLVHFLV